MSNPTVTPTPTEDPYKKAFGISSETSLKFLHDAYDENDRLRQMINNENIRYGLALSLCASFITICQRKGEHTNWEAFENQCYEAMGVKKSTLRVEKLPNASSGIITREQLNDGENDMSVINEIALRHLTEWQKLMTEVGDDGVLKDGMKPRPLIQVIINAMEEYRSQHSRQPSPNPLLEEVKRRLGELSGKVYGAEIVQRELLTELIQFSEGEK